jgi:F-type H+-transporting ATPase subunit f
VRAIDIVRFQTFLDFFTNIIKAIGAAQDAARMERVVNFYAGLPRGPAPTVKPTGLIGRYQARYFSGKNASGVRTYYQIVTSYSNQY